MKYYLIAGEKSGDLHGSNLMKALGKKDPGAIFRYWGGDMMQSVAGELVVHYNQLAVMGFLEVLSNINRIQKLISKCKADIIEYQPDVVILIDFAGFNLRIAKFASKRGIKVFYYISPKVWAWNTSRAWKIKKNVDRMFVILPFEKEFYKKFDWEVDYVGNPVLESVTNFHPDPTFKKRFDNNKMPLIAALPGSREQEIRQVLPVFSQVMAEMVNYQFLVARVSSVHHSLYEEVSGFPNVTLIDEDSYNILSIAQYAIVTSGTATLETALFNVPQVVVYKTGRVSYNIAKNLIKVPFISLVNLVAGEKVVEELIQNQCNAEKVKSEIMKLEVDEYRSIILLGYKKVKNNLGSENASSRAASLMFNYLSI